MKIALILAGAIPIVLASFESLVSAGPAPNEEGPAPSEEVSPLMSDTLIDNMGLVRHKRGNYCTPGCTPVSYKKVESGSERCERITSKAECEEAAKQLELTDTTATQGTRSQSPPYCFFSNGGYLYFNKNVDSTKH